MDEKLNKIYKLDTSWLNRIYANHKSKFAKYNFNEELDSDDEEDRRIALEEQRKEEEFQRKKKE